MKNPSSRRDAASSRITSEKNLTGSADSFCPDFVEPTPKPSFSVGFSFPGVFFRLLHVRNDLSFDRRRSWTVMIINGSESGQHFSAARGGGVVGSVGGWWLSAVEGRSGVRGIAVSRIRRKFNFGEKNVGNDFELRHFLKDCRVLLFSNFFENFSTEVAFY